VLSANVATSYTDILLDWGVLVSGHCWSIGDQCLLLLITRVDCELFSSCFHNLERVQCLVLLGGVSLSRGFTA